MAASGAPLWAVCVLRLALATVYFQEEFLDGGEGATPLVAQTQLPNGRPKSPLAPARRRGVGGGEAPKPRGAPRPPQEPK